MLKIRRYQLEDNEVVKELHNDGIRQMLEADPVAEIPDFTNFDCDLDDIEGVYQHNNGEFLVGIDGGEIVVIGAIRKVSETYAEVKRIRVRRDCQRHGYGRRIVQKLEELATKLGYSELCLDTLASNVPAQRLFEKCGFTETSRGNKGPYRLIYYGKNLNRGGV